MGLDPVRWMAALRLIEGWCEQDLMPSAGFLLARNGKTTGPVLFGRQRVGMGDQGVRIRDDAIFLIASITKPIVGLGVLRLVEQGRLCLDERVEAHIPEFSRIGKHAVTLRNLLTHTSGLPDMLPNNRELRVANSPLSAFVAGACEVPLDFPPGRGVQYQSMGFALLGELIARVTGKTCAQFLQDEFFGPLKMMDTALGAPNSWFEGKSPKVERMADVRIPEDQVLETTWNWNSRYWRQLGVPWGGLLTTPADLGRLSQMLLQGGVLDGVRVLSPVTIAAATRNQLDGMREVPEEDRRCRPWGLGWRLNWPAHSANFGEFLSPRAYGHWGATGTSLWIDPERNAFGVFLTTQPQEPQGNYLARAANAMLSAFV